MKQAKNSPGVGKYSFDNKGKILGTYKSNSAKSAFFDEATARGHDTPSHYNHVDCEKYKMRRTSDCKIWKPLKEKPNKLVKDSSVSPHTYKLEGKQYSMSQFKKILSYKF